jgi:hypothetical protein
MTVELRVAVMVDFHSKGTIRGGVGVWAQDDGVVTRRTIATKLKAAAMLLIYVNVCIYNLNYRRTTGG